MDIKFSYIRAVYLFVVLVLVVSTTSAGHRSRGSARFTSRHHNRREVRDYLAPPSQDASYTSYGPPARQPSSLQPYRPGRHLNPPPPPPSPSTEGPGYFARLASWLNPFGGSATPPPFPEISVPPYIAKFAPSHPSDVYEPPSPSPPRDSYGPPIPQPPPAGPNGYLPPNGKGKNCNPCNVVPWNPLPGPIRNDAYPSGATDVEIQPSISQDGNNNGGGNLLGYSDELRTPDFSHGLSLNSHPGQRPSFPGFSSHGNLPSVPIPYPHLYPGPMPPLFKAKPFSPSLETFRPTPSIELESGPPEHAVDSTPSVTGFSTPNSVHGYVDVLPPGAEVDTSEAATAYASGNPDSPPSGYQKNHGDGYGSSSFSVQQSTEIGAQQLSTELTAGYKIQEPGSFEITKSVPTEISGSVDHPIHYEQSPLIDLSNHNEKPLEDGESQSGADDYNTPGLNPPSPNDPAGSYGGPPDKNRDASSGRENPGNFHGSTSDQNSPGDSSVASTVSNGTLSQPTPAYRIPDVGALPISHEQTPKPPVYEAYPPSTEKFLISVGDSSNSAEAQGGHSSASTFQHGGNLRGNEEVVDSYQHQVNPSVVGSGNRGDGQSSFVKTPEPLVPYRPSSLYVPYPPYSGPSSQSEKDSSSSLDDSGPTTQEPFLDALLKSYNNFKQEMDAKDQMLAEQQGRFKAEGQQIGPAVSGGTTWVSQPQPSFASPDKLNPSVYASGNANGNSETRKQQSGVKKNKQVQIIIPYTSQYTPGPFRPVDDDWSGRGPLEQTQGRKVPSVGAPDYNYIGEESKSVEITRPLRPLENLLINELAEKPPAKKANTSIDVLRLQKNIDNWTIQEYSRGITSSTALPSSSHPYLLPSKKIPHEYLTSTQSSSTEENLKQNRSDLPGLNYNDLEHEGAASSRVDVPHIQVLRVEGVSKPVEYEARFTTTASTSTEATSSPSPSVSSTSSSTEASWAELPVSISPHNNERVYVVTPQPERSSKSWPGVNDRKYEVIERAYQVLPQAVNNLASTSVSGPDAAPLWGIMEHDQYARSDRGNSSSDPPILYSGHSKVSNARH